jgi:hypothetical protein
VRVNYVDKIAENEVEIVMNPPRPVKQIRST